MSRSPKGLLQDQQAQLIAAAIIFSKLEIEEGQELKAYAVAVRDVQGLKTEIRRIASGPTSSGSQEQE